MKITLIERTSLKSNLGPVFTRLLLLFAAMMAYSAYIGFQLDDTSDPLKPALILQGLLVIPLALLVYIVRSKAYTPARLHVSREQIELEPGQLFGLRLFRPWSISANSIGEIKVQYPVPLLPAAIVELKRFPRRILNLAIWLEENKNDWLPKRLPKEGIASIIDSSPAYRALIAMGYNIILPDEKTNSTGDLTGHPMGKAVLVIFMTLFFYAVLDFGLGAERYVEFTPGTWMAVVAAAVGAASWFMVSKTPMNKETKLGLALLTGLAAAGATYPGLLRVNLYTNDLQPQTQIYELVERREDFKALNGYWAVLVATDAKLPQLVLNDPWGYFEKRKLGSHYKFEIRRGMLGFYQVRLDPEDKINPAPVAIE